jgi:hypothetical protein
MTIDRRVAIAVTGAMLTLAVSADAQQASAAASVPSNPERNAYFGDLHLHTSYSFDAFILFGAKVDPEGAYRFGRGDVVSYLGDDIRRSSPPLDFLAVTDHSENIGVFNTLEDPNSPLSRSELGKEVKEQGPAAFAKLIPYQTGGGGKLPGVDVSATAQSAWDREVAAANRYYEPGKFTTFIAYRGDQAPNPFTSAHSAKPEDLWSFLHVIRKQGYEALAIPHNSNASNGLMFDWVDSRGRPIDQAYAELRAANEPLAEISQNKGSSETHPALSPNDEFANFELYDHLLISPTAKSKPEGSYVRDALGRGLVLEERTQGVNPFKYGIVGASDYHNGLSDAAENAFVGTFGAIDPTKKLPDIDKYAENMRSFRKGAGGLTDEQLDHSFYENGSGNLTGVWAEQNTRESIYDALRRKETFATSGTRMRFRFFGSWDLPSDLLKRNDWVATAYRSAVSMGGDLPAKPAEAVAPTFTIWAVKDPNGANLDRVQVVKLWRENGKHVEKVFDVALSNGRKVDARTGKAPAVGNTVNLQTATYKNSIGATSLATLWRDPAFDASRPAVYYLRVLEIPTPRWSTILAVKRHQPVRSDVPVTVQERGWSSPIWYTPTAVAGARVSASATSGGAHQCQSLCDRGELVAADQALRAEFLSEHCSHCRHQRAAAGHEDASDFTR